MNIILARMRDTGPRQSRVYGGCRRWGQGQGWPYDLCNLKRSQITRGTQVGRTLRGSVKVMRLVASLILPSSYARSCCRDGVGGLLTLCSKKGFCC